MSLQDYIKFSIVILRRNRLIWLFSGFLFFSQFLNLLIPNSNNIGQGIFKLLLIWIVSMYGLAGVIYTAASAISDQENSFVIANSAIIRHLPLLGLFFFTPIIIESLFAWGLASVVAHGIGTLASLSNILISYGLLIEIIGSVLFPAIVFCFAGILLDNLSIIKVIKRGYRIYSENLILVLAVSLLYYFIWMILRILGSGLFLIINPYVAAGLLQNPSLNVLGFILHSKYSLITSLIFFPLLIDPIQRIIITFIYKNTDLKLGNTG